MILEKRIPLAYWFHKIKWDVLFVLLFSSLASFLATQFFDLEIPISVGAFMGTAIALLLSFKLAQSYDRWWEARKIWGAIVNDSRTLVIQILNFTGKSDKELTKKMAHRQIAWCYALSKHLRNQDAVGAIERFISREELNLVRYQSSIPLALLNQHSKDLGQLYSQKSINEYQQIQIDDTLVRLCASMGKAERIKNTYFPKTYRLTLHLFIYTFLVTLSLALDYLPGPIEVLLMFFISLPFFLLEKIAFSIQDPFENNPTDTPMTAISRTIEIGIKHLLGAEKDDFPDPIEPTSFYIM